MISDEELERTLQVLIDDGLVEKTTKDGEVAYKLTPAGLEMAEKVAAAMERNQDGHLN